MPHETPRSDKACAGTPRPSYGVPSGHHRERDEGRRGYASDIPPHRCHQDWHHVHPVRPAREPRAVGRGGRALPGPALAQPGACRRGRAPAQQETGRAAHAHPTTLAGPCRGDSVLRRRHGGRVHGVALVRDALLRCGRSCRHWAPSRSGRCSRSGTRRPPCRRSGRPACTTDRRSRGPGSPAGSEPRRASRRPRRGTRRWWGHGCSPAPRTRATSCGRGRGSWERRGSTWSRCLPRGSRRSCCGPGSRRRSGSHRSCAGRRSHRPTRPWGWRRPSCFGW